MNQDNCRIKVNLKNNPYEVVVGSEILYTIGEELLRINIRTGEKILIVTNPDVSKPYSRRFITSLKEAGYDANLLILEAGENKKNYESIALIHNAAYEHQLDRGSLIIALGGGVIGDMAGFAAATWLRGIDFVQVPTTLLAMVDASVGGKTGVNHPKGKNLIGAFHQPKLVLIDINTLKTLPQREFRSGMAEIIKYGVIKDLELFNKLENEEDLSNIYSIKECVLLELIKISVSIKARIVEKDEKESGLRAILNYGHTFGHVIETLCGYGHWLHGEAVSMGMVLIGQLALRKNLWNVDDALRQEKLLTKAGLPISWPKINNEDVLRTLKGDKKVDKGNIRLIVPLGIGMVEILNDFSENEIKSLLESI
ncbi:3-dehydroquinate synthase [Prochlorococcus sp. SS52]|uniref:3-dehydroquinate synthase n=1 Tax=Prochlorococcus sp. SS52 TaxID=1499501 RepID=UPI000533B60F|nr:3-dehydroquinate synthase [Prochlorococcus sp. SS52]KGG35020.1 3-dehydroquinate synthase [Prochlorococcus sp. SS52]